MITSTQIIYESIEFAHAEERAGLAGGTIARERFLHDHHHLMCPWAYGDGEKKRRDGILFRRQWQRQTQ